MKIRNNSFQLIAITMLLILLIGCKENSSDKNSFVSGTIDLSDGSSLENLIRARVLLEDVSIADIGSIKLGEVIISPIEELPIKFSIPYSTVEIKSSRSYSIYAEVIELNENGEEERAYLTTQSYPVITGGFDGSVNVLVERVN